MIHAWIVLAVGEVHLLLAEWHSSAGTSPFYSLICISHMTSNPHCRYDRYSGRVGHLLHIHFIMSCLTSIGGPYQHCPPMGEGSKNCCWTPSTWHEFVWCAKLRCVGLTAKWEDRGGFKEGTTWASHNENIMSHDLWNCHEMTRLRTVQTNLGSRDQTSCCRL